MTKIRIAKKAAHMIVAMNVSAVVIVQVKTHFDIEDESIPLEIGGFVVGNLVANQTDKITDRIIDGIVQKWQSRKANAEDTAE